MVGPLPDGRGIVGTVQGHRAISTSRACTPGPGGKASNNMQSANASTKKRYAGRGR
jgi:hypothetical protein